MKLIIEDEMNYLPAGGLSSISVKVLCSTHSPIPSNWAAVLGTLFCSDNKDVAGKSFSIEMD